LIKLINHDNNVSYMNIFFISIMPLFYWAVQNLFDNQDVGRRDIIIPFILGFVIAVPIQLLYWAMDIYFALTWKPIELFFYTFLNKEGFLYYPIILLILFLYRRKNDGSLYIREIAAIFCGYFFLLAVVDFLTTSTYSSYDLLMLPLLRIVTLLTASLLINRFLSAFGKMRYFLLTGIALLPLVLNIFPLLFLLNKLTIGIVLFIPVLLLSLLFSYSEIQGAEF